MSIKSGISIVAAILFFVGFFGRAHAQTKVLVVEQSFLDELETEDNPYNIDDDLYEIFKRADKKRYSLECLSIADTLRREAIRLGDKKAECLAGIAELNYYSTTNSLDSMKIVGHRVCEFARDNDLLQYYYQSFNLQCITLINCGRYQEAKTLIDNMRYESIEDDFPYGLYSCYIQTAHFYEIQSEFSSAVDYYMLAAEFMEKNIPDQSPSNAYLLAATACLNSFNFTEALDFALKSLDKASELSTFLDIYDTICTSLYVMKRFDEFNEFYDKFESVANVYGSIGLQKSRAPGLDSALKGNTNRAIQLLKQSREGHIRSYLCRLVYERDGNFKDALALSDTTLWVVTNAYKLAVNLKSEEMMALLDTKRLQQENAELEMANERGRRMAVIGIFFSVLMVLVIAAFIIIRRTREHVRQLEKANAAKDNFVKLMSHEVRTPLNVISGFSNILISDEENVTKAEKNEFRDSINDSVNMLVSLFDGVLDALDLDSGEMLFDFKPASVNLICRSAIKSTEGRVPKKVELTYLTDIPDNLLINTDSKRTQQILINLLSNSFKATSEGRIELRTVLEDNVCCFILTDTGKGIPKDKAEMVFERFYKVDEFQNGTGLGLAVSRDIAKKLHGTLTLDTSYTSGARFVLKLPRD